ncbi:HAD family phosphatase [Ilyomonas limi]|uniref:HAD family phosphatase n=1 Tax=Ilyomonas limi TaxID=2575867 RepID=A0A4U3L6V8_9BACT|nr:HAD family phosphatase [Ilyomonas limi]TKK70742.1 HAD family phosphatase [Ilyomonas limi]
MSTTIRIKALLLDIGGVFLTNGWGHQSRRLAAQKFNIDYDEMNERHKVAFDAYETGKINLNEYLQLIVFYQKKSFTKEDFKDFMFAQSQPLQPMIDWIYRLKQQYKIKTASVNNEGRELNDYRVCTFQLNRFIDVFVSSSYVHLRKPDKDIYKLAMDILLVKPEETVYIDDRPIFIEVAKSLGIHAIHHVNLEQTKLCLDEFGLSME